VATLRRATVSDAQALTELRAFMHLAMGDEPTQEWRDTCEATLRRRLAEEDRFVGFLVEDDGAAVAGGVGWLEEHLPSPYQLDGRRGHIASMSTHPDHRRHGYGRLVMRALMGWFAEHDIPRVDLRATPYGQPLYEAEGFRVLGGATMAWTRPGVRPGMGR
jgi:GNAT superfamily N-acetyltransferase